MSTYFESKELYFGSPARRTRLSQGRSIRGATSNLPPIYPTLPQVSNLVNVSHKPRNLREAQDAVGVGLTSISKSCKQRPSCAIYLAESSECVGPAPTPTNIALTSLRHLPSSSTAS